MADEIHIVTGLEEADYKGARERSPRFDFEVVMSVGEEAAALLDAGEHACSAVVSEDRRTITFTIRAGALIQHASGAEP